MGYSGGTTEDPTYENIGDYMETIELDYDPEEISYKELLQIFFRKHSPEYQMTKRQYMSAIFYRSEVEKETAVEAMQQEEKRLGLKLYTHIIPFERFYLAEAYHQKYYLQLVDILKSEIRNKYASFKEFNDSREAARMNGYVKGLGDMELLMAEIDSFGLSDKGRKRLIEIVDSYE